MFLIDAENAFNKINRVAALWNCQFICPSLKYGLINFYRSPSRIFLASDGKFAEFSSQEGTTQGCPLAMAMFAIALKPLHDELKSLCKQAWFADDGTGCDTFSKMRNMYDALLARGPLYGYFMQSKKCILIVKEGREEVAEEVAKKFFGDTGIVIQERDTLEQYWVLGLTNSNLLTEKLPIGLEKSKLFPKSR